MAAFLYHNESDEESGSISFHVGENVLPRVLMFLLAPRKSPIALHLDGDEMERAKQIVLGAGLKWLNPSGAVKRIEGWSRSEKALIVLILSNWK